jgi:ABC-type uncharacterized transport system auxiliary subunit
MMSRALAPALLALLLGACASAPGIPETTWHRLPPPAEVQQLPRAASLPIVVQRLQADGLHSDQALLYAIDTAGHRLRAYHYNLWVEPPGYLLQRRLIGRLRAAGAADTVTDTLPVRSPALWVSGQIHAFERVPRAEGGYEGRVELRLRVEDRATGLPVLDREYQATVAVGEDSLPVSVQALSTALDQVIAEFLDDLGAHLAEPTA